MQIKITKVGGCDFDIPKNQTEGSAGFDLKANIGLKEEITLYHNYRSAISTGFAVAIPRGYVGIIKPRSGLAVKHGIDVLAGVIDSDYRGEIRVVLQNHGDEPMKIKHGERIAQLLIFPSPDVEFVEEYRLDETERGEGGFGSTG